MPALKEIQAQQNTLTEWRRDIHRNPETAYEEFDTAAFVSSLLKKWGLDVHEKIGKTGVVGVLKGKTNQNGKSIAIRADMDALNIKEENTFEHCSKNDGKMHACGHDGHTTMLLGAIEYLAKTKNFDGTVIFIFQPAEESHAGAQAMIDDGLFDQFKFDEIYGMHNWPGLPAGHFSICPGGMTAASDRVSITLTGKSGHGAMPHLNTDVITTGSEIVMALQTLVSRKVKPIEPAVISVCTFHSGSSVNVMPEQAELSASVRSFSEQTRNMLEKGIEQVVTHIANAHDVKADVVYTRGYPSVKNDPDSTEFLYEVAKDLVGEENADMSFEPTMGAEDFAFFLQQKKGAYIAMGQGEDRAGLHNAKYDFNDETLAIGASFWARVVEMKLSV